MKYPLLPYSQLVFDMLKINPDVYALEFALRANIRGGEVEHLKRAIEMALRNHPVLSMRIDKNGMQYPYAPTDIFHGPYHSIEFLDEGNSVCIKVSYSRILGDLESELLVFEDVSRAYDGLPLQHDYFWDYLRRIEEDKLSSRYAINRQWLETEYGHISCPVRPQTDVPLKPDDFGQEGVLVEDYSDMRKALVKLAEEHLLSLSAAFSVASALAIMEYNSMKEAALTWAYNGRETNEEQRICGSLHRDIPFKLSYSENRETIYRVARQQFRDGIAHSSYPFTLTKPHTDIWNYALNVLVQPTLQEKLITLPITFEDVTPHSDFSRAYSLLDVEIYDAAKLIINYRYSASHYKESSIRRFAALVHKYAEWLLE